MLPKWKDGVRLTTSDGKHEVRFGGRIHNDWLFGDEIEPLLADDSHEEQDKTP